MDCRVKPGNDETHTPIPYVSSGEAFHQTFEHLRAVRTGERWVGESLRMRHEAEDGSCLVVDAGDIVARAVWIGLGRHLALRVAIAEGDAALAFEPRKR